MSLTLTPHLFDQSGVIQPLYLNILLGIYMFSYIFLVCILILFFSMFMDNFNTTLTFKATLGMAIKFRLR
jgi:hypothetical protein